MVKSLAYFMNIVRESYIAIRLRYIVLTTRLSSLGSGYSISKRRSYMGITLDLISRANYQYRFEIYEC